MSRRTVLTNDLQPGTVFMVRGKLVYSRLISQIEGEELQKDITKRQQMGWIPITKPYTTATISQAQVIYKNPNHKLPEEIYAEESLFTSSAQRAQGGFSFTGLNKGYKLPYLGVLRPGATAVVDQVIPEGELANALDVTLVMRVFQGKPNRGVTLDGVIANEPIRYYNSDEPGTGLSDMGITFHKAETERKPEETPVVTPKPAKTVNPNPYTSSTPIQSVSQTLMTYGDDNTEDTPEQPTGIRYNPQTDRNY